MKFKACDVLIVGAGMVGLCLAYQLLERHIASNIVILEKEFEPGRHSSGRNSGVLHAGLCTNLAALRLRFVSRSAEATELGRGARLAYK